MVSLAIYILYKIWKIEDVDESDLIPDGFKTGVLCDGRNVDFKESDTDVLSIDQRKNASFPCLIRKYNRYYSGGLILNK